METGGDAAYITTMAEQTGLTRPPRVCVFQNIAYVYLYHSPALSSTGNIMKQCNELYDVTEQTATITESTILSSATNNLLCNTFSYFYAFFAEEHLKTIHIKSCVNYFMRFFNTVALRNNSQEAWHNNMGYWHQRADERHGNPPPR